MLFFISYFSATYRILWQEYRILWQEYRILWQEYRILVQYALFYIVF